jgi:hypothetical protein
VGSPEIANVTDETGPKNPGGKNICRIPDGGDGNGGVAKAAGAKIAAGVKCFGERHERGARNGCSSQKERCCGKNIELRLVLLFVAVILAVALILCGIERYFKNLPYIEIGINLRDICYAQYRRRSPSQQFRKPAWWMRGHFRRVPIRFNG